MSLPLSFAQEKIEESIYQALRTVLVEEGYLPDIDAYTGANDVAGYEAAMKVITTTEGFCVELFGASGQRAKDLKRVPRIVIRTRRFIAGDVGSPPEVLNNPVLNEDDEITSYEQTRVAPLTSNLHIDITMISKTQAQDRIMNAVVGKALTARKYQQVHDDADPLAKFFIFQTGYNDFGEFEEGLMEKTVNYEVPDIYITGDEITGTIAPISEITITPTLLLPDLEDSIDVIT